jgi:hypothetical protein
MQLAHCIFFLLLNLNVLSLEFLNFPEPSAKPEPSLSDPSKIQRH